MAESRQRRMAEVAGVIGVVASMIFVGLEIRESSRATRAATDAEIAAQFVEVNLAMHGNVDLMRAFAEVREVGDPSLVSLESQLMMQAHARALFHVWSNAHRQEVNGSANPHLFRGVLQEMSSYFSPQVDGQEGMNRRRRLYQWAWESEGFLYNPDFQALVDSIANAGE